VILFRLFESPEKYHLSYFGLDIESIVKSDTMANNLMGSV